MFSKSFTREMKHYIKYFGIVTLVVLMTRAIFETIMHKCIKSIKNENTKKV